MQQGPKLWKYIVIPLGIGIVLFAIFGGVAYFLMNGSKTSKYNQAVNAYTAGNYEEAARQFEKLGDYRDSKKRSEESLILMHYNNGKQAFQSGEYDKAKEEYLAAGDYENAKLLAEECERASYYAKGESLGASGDLDKAIEEFKKSEYKDFKDKIADLYVKKSDKALSDGQSDQALQLAKTAADYKGSEEPVLSCYYKMGEEAFAKNDLKNAASCFINAEEYKDAPDQAKSIYYTLGTDALGKKDYENAAAFLKLAGDHKDAATIAKEAFYITGTNRYKEKNYQAAREFLKLAGNYKDSRNLYLASTYVYALSLMKEKKYGDAAELYEECGSYKFSKDMVNACLAEAQLEAGKLWDAASTYAKVSKKAKISGFDIQGRKAFISRWYSMDRICGDYAVMNNYVQAQKRYPAFIRYVTFTSIHPNQAVSIKYSANNDGTFNITGAVSWARIGKWSENKANMRVILVVSRFEYSHIKKFPTTIKLSGGAKLTYKNGTFKCSFNKKSGKVKYTSSVVYR
ncbi:MAG: hypothetical protein K5869_12500 [Saccharofermentans sp.]|nr:hypothetical protein [Saccharofermentans sp.]